MPVDTVRALAIDYHGPASVPGTVKWVDDSGVEMVGTTEVKANTAYKWLFTPDSENYNTISGEITLWHKSTDNATVSVSDAQIDKVAVDGAGAVTIDVSGLTNVESATVPSHVVEKTNKAADTGLTVALPSGSVTLDETALKSVTENADDKDVTVSVVSVPTANLSPAVKDIIGMEPTVAAVVDVNITANGQKQSTFNGGKLTISIPYTPKEGEDTSKLTVWFITISIP